MVYSAGCIKTSTEQVLRDDQDLVGNRGVIHGETPPPEVGRTSTRTIGVVEVTMPPSTGYKKKKAELASSPPPKFEFAPAHEEPAAEGDVEADVMTERETVQNWGTAAEEDAAPVRRVVMEERAVVEVEEERPEAPQQTYEVQKDDTLQKISNKFYGTTTKWPEIFEANKEVLSDPSKIYPGQVIVIPGLEEEDIK